MAISELTKPQLPNIKQKLWTANFILMCFSNLTAFMSFHILLPTLPIYIQNHGGSKGTVGLALAFIMFGAIAARPFTGWALDNFNRKIILMLGLLTFLLPSLVYISMLSVIPLLIFRAIQGLGWGIGNTAHATVASDIIPRLRLGEGLGFFSLTISISLAMAPALGLWLVDNYSFTYLFFTCSGLASASLLLALMVKYPKTNPLPAKTKLVFIEMQALRPAVLALLLGLSYSSLVSFLALFARQKGMTTAGLFFTFLAIISVLSRPLGGRFIDMKGKRGYDFVISIGSIAIIICMVVLAQTSAPWYLVLGGILYGIGFGFLQPSLMALCINSVPADRKGAANATYWTAYDIGVALGSIVWGILSSSYGYSTMFLVNAIPPVIALFVYFWKSKPAAA